MDAYTATPGIESLVKADGESFLSGKALPELPSSLRLQPLQMIMARSKKPETDFQFIMGGKILSFQSGSKIAPSLYTFV